MQRPWSGQEEQPQQMNMPDFDANNPLCPGVTRSNGNVYALIQIKKLLLNNYFFSKIQNMHQHLFSQMIFQPY